jgi:hypothetical protein
MRPIEQAFNLGLDDRYSERQWNSIRGMLTIPFVNKKN